MNHRTGFFRPIIAFTTVFLLLLSCSKDDLPQEPREPAQSIHLTLGSPASSQRGISPVDDYLMIKPQYVLSYNKERGTPNWVSWHLDKSWMGTAQRQNDFRSDTSLPQGWYRVQSTDYTNSGFDRGHNCPSADRTRTEEDNSATFLMTNMIPQAPQHNQVMWEGLESYCRTLVGRGSELYIIMGSYGTGGTGSMGTRTTIAGGKVTVPARIWKVVVVLPEGSNDLKRVTSTTRVIAVDTPNDQSVAPSWGTYRTTVDAIEAATGYDLLSALEERLEAELETKVDNGPTS